MGSWLRLYPASEPADTVHASTPRIEETERWGRQELAALAVCCMSQLLVFMDNTIVNVALPSIGRDFHAPLSGLQWIVDAYLVVLGSLLVSSGAIGDRWGRRNTFQLGISIFTVASLLCSLAPSLGCLIAFRMLQAVGGSMLNPVALAIIRNTFHNPRRCTQAIGFWTSVVGISMALGPVLGGTLTLTLGWRSIFWVNLPVGLVAFVLCARFVPESRADRARRLDPVGQITMIVALACLIFGIIEGPGRGWTSGPVVGLFALAGAAAVGFVRYELHRREPLLDVQLLRMAQFTGVVLIAVVAFSAFSGFLFLNTLYLQEGRNLSAFDAGLYTIPMAIGTFGFSTVSGWLTGRAGPRPPLILAGVLMSVGAVFATQSHANTPLSWLIILYLIFGAGFGTINTPISNIAVASVPRAQAGVGAAVASTSRQVGQALGVAVAGAVARGYGGVLHGSFSRAALPAWWFIASCSMAVVVIAQLATRSRTGKVLT